MAATSTSFNGDQTGEKVVYPLTVVLAVCGNMQDEDGKSNLAYPSLPQEVDGTC